MCSTSVYPVREYDCPFGPPRNHGSEEEEGKGPQNDLGMSGAMCKVFGYSEHTSTWG